MDRSPTTWMRWGLCVCAAAWGCDPSDNPPSGTTTTGAAGNGGQSTSTGGTGGGQAGGTTGGTGQTGGAGGGAAGSGGAGGEALCTDVAQCPGKISIAHAWGITNPSPGLWKSGYAPVGEAACSWDPAQNCRAIIEKNAFICGGAPPPGSCCATTPNGPLCDVDFSGKWQSWIRDWWTQGWLPSIGVSKADVRRAHVIYNRNGLYGGPYHYVDCEARGQLVGVFVSAYRQCDTHAVVTTHSNGGVTFLAAWKTFVDDFLDGAQGAGLDQDRATTCAAKGRMLANGDVPPLYVNGQLMQAAVGSSAPNNNFPPLQPYDSVGKKYWEPRSADGKLRALPGIRFYYNHEDVATYDLKKTHFVGRNEVQDWLDGKVDKDVVGQAFWDAHTGQPPFIALHVCDNNVICGDRLAIISPDDIPNFCSTACSGSCPTVQSFYDSSMAANSLCLNPCHKNCWAPTALTAVLIKDPSVYPEKFPFIFGNSNLKAMSADMTQGGWLENKMKLDWTELYDLQRQWCGQESVNDAMEPYAMGQGPKFGPLIDGRNEATGEVTF